MVKEGDQALQEVEVDAPADGESMADGESILFWLNPDTKLPVHAEKQDSEDGQWTTVGWMHFTFNQKILASVFDPSKLKA